MTILIHQDILIKSTKADRRRTFKIASKKCCEQVIKKNLSELFPEIQLNLKHRHSNFTNYSKTKLKKYGIAPPEFKTTDKNAILGAPKQVVCPRCNSTETNLVSSFGSTACKAMYTCKKCYEPFEYFKCL